MLLKCSERMKNEKTNAQSKDETRFHCTMNERKREEAKENEMAQMKESNKKKCSKFF